MTAPNSLFMGEAILRIASIPEAEVWEMVAKIDSIGEIALHNIYGRSFLRGAMRMASISLNDALDQIDINKIQRPLLRYLIRAGTRATPFGAFASVNAVRLHHRERTFFHIADERLLINLHPKADETLRKKFQTAIETPLKQHWIQSPSLQIWAGTLRCLSPSFGEGKSSTTVIGISDAVMSALKLAKNPISGQKLVEQLCRMDSAAEPAQLKEFLRNLAEVGLLVPQTHQQPASLSIRDPFRSLTVHPLQPDDNTSKLLGENFGHVVAHRIAVNGSIDSNLINDVMEAAKVLRALWPTNQHPLQAFAVAFGAKHEGRAVPLLHAVDEELGFDLNGQPRHPSGTLLSELEDHPTILTERDRNDTKVSHTLLKLFENACLTGNYRQRLDHSDLKRNRNRWPTSMAAVIRLNVDGDIYLDTMVGPSSSRMLARFGRSNNTIASLLKDLAFAEMQLVPEALHAEVCFSPDDPVLNTIIRPCSYPYRIILDGFWNPNNGRDIPVNDLLLVLRRGRLALIQQSSGREIIPHISHTANQERNNWPILHRILALLEPESTFESLRFRWGGLDDAKHLPRVNVGRVIVSLERWRLDGPLNGDELDHECIRQSIPNRVDLINSEDPPLALNLGSRSCREILQRAIAKHGSVLLRERWPEDDRWAVKGASGHYAHELILPLQTGQPDERGRDRHCTRNHQKLKKSESETSIEWHAIHLECAPSQATQILLLHLAPLIYALQKSAQIKHWHFVRAATPNFHLRLRLKPAKGVNESTIRNLVRKACLEPCEQGLIRSISEIPYCPEIWRYGSNKSLDISESFFHIDSNHTLDLLATLGNEVDEKSLVFAATLSCIATTLALTDNMKSALELCKYTQNTYGPRLKKISDLAKQFDLLQRSIRSHNAPQIWIRIKSLNQIHKQRVRAHSQELAKISSHNLRKWEPQMSYLHMSCNRLFRFAPNAHEPLVYELSRRSLHSELQRKNSTNTDSDRSP